MLCDVLYAVLVCKAERRAVWSIINANVSLVVETAYCIIVKNINWMLINTTISRFSTISSNNVAVDIFAIKSIHVQLERLFDILSDSRSFDFNAKMIG